MDTSKSATVEATCSCGHKLKIPFDQAEAPFTCLSCGAEDRFNSAQIAAINIGFGQALGDAVHQRDAGSLDPIGEAKIQAIH